MRQLALSIGTPRAQLEFPVVNRGVRQNLEPQPRSRIEGEFQNPNLTNHLFDAIAEVNM